MNIIFRADASVHIGSGHVMRCLTLAQQLKRVGHHVLFVCQKAEGHLGEVIRSKGFDIVYLSTNLVDVEEDAQETVSIIKQLQYRIDWMIVDHYQLDVEWEGIMRPYVKFICVIDDLANRKHHCEILIDQNLFPDMEQRYAVLVPDTCLQFIGPKYAILREEFYEARKMVSVRRGEIERILVFFGGSDETNETMKTLRALSSLSKRLVVDVVVGASNPYRQEIEEFCRWSSSMNFHYQIDYMAELMAKADLSIGGGGSTIWERCFLGLPSFTIPIAENQMATTAAVADYGATWDLGWYQDISSEDIAQYLRKVVGKPMLIRQMSEKCFELMGDRMSYFHPVLQTMEKMSKE